MVSKSSREENLFRYSRDVSKIGMRLSQLDFTRATEQISILTSRFACMKERRGIGHLTDQKSMTKRKQLLAQSIEKNAFGLLFGYLEDTQGCTRIVHSGPYIEGNNNLLEHGNIFGRDKDTPANEWTLDIVSSPTDGLFDMVSGRDHGAVSAISCGPKNTFALPGLQSWPEGRCSLTHYFVVAIGPDLSPAKIFPEFLQDEHEKGVDELIINEKLIQTLDRQKDLKNRRFRLTINTMSRLTAALSRNAQVKTRYGSSIVAALSAIFPQYGIDAFVGVLNPTQALIIAASTLALKGQMWAVPVFFTEERGARFRVPPIKLKVLCAEDFVLNDNTFVIVTGITGDMIPKGVRFPDDNSVDTETICLRILTKSRRIINYRHELRKSWIRFIGVPLQKGESYRSLALLYPEAVEYFDEYGSWVGK